VDLHIALSDTGLAMGVYDQLREAILDGRLQPGAALPATRELAARLGVSRNTVTGAYQRLNAEGFVVGRVGAGTFVSNDLPGTRARRAPAGVVLEPLARWREPTERDAVDAVRHDFRIGAPDSKLFPWDDWRRSLARHLRSERKRTAAYGRPEGLPELREAIARHVGLVRAVHAGADDVLVTSGAQQAFDLIARVLVDRGTCVAIEEPGYPPARAAFAAAGAKIAPVPVDDEGLVVAKLPRNARVVYVTPSHQFPLGVAMSLARRLELLRWAEQHGAAIVEDDYDSDFRFDGRSLEPLQCLDHAGRVLYVGTFSKVLLPALRIGFVVAPPSIMPALRAARSLTDSYGSPFIQAALAELVADGTLARHIRRARRTYHERRDRLLEAIDRELADVLTVIPGSAGLHLSAWLRDRRLEPSLSRRTAAAGVRVQSLTPYFVGRARPGIALGIGVIRRSQVDAGIAALAACLR
jgi:GntR family transcriptional regulator/MocR family aminotransferase